MTTASHARHEDPVYVPHTYGRPIATYAVTLSDGGGIWWSGTTRTDLALAQGHRIAIQIVCVDGTRFSH